MGTASFSNGCLAGFEIRVATFIDWRLFLCLGE
jgi:hypothetical protein